MSFREYVRNCSLRTSGLAAALVLVAVTTLCSCLGTDVGNPEEKEDGGTIEAEIRFQGVEQSASVDDLMIGSGTRLEEAWIVADGFGLRPAGECGRAARMRTDTPTVVDLLDDTGDSMISIPEVTPGTYCGLDFQLERVSQSQLPSAAPPELSEATVLLTGEREDGVEFRLSADVKFKLKLGSITSQFELDADRRRMLLVVALGRWVDEQKLNAIQGEEPIVIDADNHREIYKDFRQSLHKTMKLYRDSNGDGRLNASERGKQLGQSRAPENPAGNNPSANGRGSGRGRSDAGMGLGDVGGK